ncbi:MAG: glycosyltransferase family 39 protein, partial [Candidatus Curtissbacteria bacterium]
TKLGLVSGSGPLDPNHLSYYTHNVPLHPLAIALSFYFFGQGEFQARIVSVIASLGILFFVYKITERLFSPPTAILASLLLITSPMIVYFGSNVFPEPLTIFFSLASFYFFVLWLGKKNNRDFYTFVVLSAFSMFFVWGSYFLPPFLALYLFLFEKRINISKKLIVGFLPIFVFCLFLLHLYTVHGSSFISGLTFAFTSRLNLPAQTGSEAFSTKAFLVEDFHRTIAYYSKTTILLSAGWVLLFVSSVVRRNYDKRGLLLFTLLLWGMSYSLVFQKAAYIHDYFLIYLAPAIAISAAAFSVHVLGWAKPKKYAKFATAIIILGLTLAQVLQTKSFTSALLSSEGNRSGKELGDLISTTTQFNDKILVLSGQFGAFFGVFTNYYGDRKIIYSDYSLEDFQIEQVDKKYNYIVYIEGRDTKEEVAAYLADNYQLSKNGIFTIFKTQK